MVVVKFSDKTEAEIMPVSSQYCLAIQSVDTATVAAFEQKLTAENLREFEIIDKETGKVTASGENFKYVGKGNSSMTFDQDSTTFMLQPMSDVEIQLARTNELVQACSSAIMDLAVLAAGGN